MKRFILSIIYLFSCLFSLEAQILYGTTAHGGNEGGGSIDKFVPATNNLTVEKSLESLDRRPYANFVQANDGKLYGMTSDGGSLGYGVIFSFDPASFKYTKLKDFDGTNGGGPYGSLLQAKDGKLYGMT